jgi:hypothetical protein
MSQITLLLGPPTFPVFRTVPIVGFKDVLFGSCLFVVCIEENDEHPLKSNFKNGKKETMKYLLLFCGNQEGLAAWQALSEEERAQQHTRANQWVIEHSSQVQKSYALRLPHTVTSIQVGAGGQPLVTDGPFLEGTEVIGGFAEIEVADLDEALRLARTWPDYCPYYGVVEIWPVVVERLTHG